MTVDTQETNHAMDAVRTKSISHLVSLLKVTENKNAPMVTGLVLEDHYATARKIENTPGAEDYVSTVDGGKVLSKTWSDAKPKASVTEKLIYSFIHGEPALGLSVTANIWTVLSEEEYEAAIAEISGVEVKEPDENDLSAFAAFVADRKDFLPILTLLKNYGETVDNITDGAVYNKTRTRNIDIEIMVDGTYVPHAVNETVVCVSRVFKSLHNAYFINMSVGLSLGAIVKRTKV